MAAAAAVGLIAIGIVLRPSSARQASYVVILQVVEQVMRGGRWPVRIEKPEVEREIFSLWSTRPA